MKITKVCTAVVAMSILVGCTAVERREIPPIDLKSIEMEKFPYKFSINNIKESVSFIAKEDKFRVQGSDFEKEVRKYVFDSFKNTGLEVTETPFTVEKALVDEIGVVTARPSNELFISKAVLNSPSTSNDGIKGSIAAIEDNKIIDENKVKGKIILFSINKNEDITMIVNEAAGKGALGALVYTKGSELNIGNPKSNDILKIPVRAITEKDGNIFSNTSKSFDGFSVDIISKSETRKIDTSNIVAVLKGENTQGKNIILTSFTDSPTDPGAASAATSISFMMEMAKVLSTKKLNVDVYFVVLSGAELTNGGTENYLNTLTEDMVKNNLLTLNLDSIGRDLRPCFVVKDEASKKEMENLMAQIEVNNAVYKNYKDEYGILLGNKGLKSVGFSAEEDIIKNTISDKPWTVDYNKVRELGIVLFKIIDKLGISR